MKKMFAAVTAALVLVTLFSGCAQPAAVTAEPVATETPVCTTPPAEPEATPEPAPVELIVFAAASMTESLNTIQQMYRKVAPQVTILYNFDSSGTLKTQIEEGADCDLFISAGQKQMNQLDSTAAADVNPEGLDFVEQGTRFDLVSNEVVMIVPEGSESAIASFEDVLSDAVSLIALGNSDVPVGQYSEEIYTNLGLWEDLVNSGKVSYGTNVKEVLSQVASASVDCGIVYSTDAATATGVKVVCAAPAGSHKSITYPAAVLKTAQHPDAAKAFAAYLQSDACSAVFEQIGFLIPQR